MEGQRLPISSVLRTRAFDTVRRNKTESAFVAHEHGNLKTLSS